MDDLVLTKAKTSDSEFAYNTKKAAFKEYVEKAGGWDEKEQRTLHDTRFVSQCYNWRISRVRIVKQILFRNRSEFRNWLKINALSGVGIWLVFDKKGNLETLKRKWSDWGSFMLWLDWRSIAERWWTFLPQILQTTQQNKQLVGKEQKPCWKAWIAGTDDRLWQSKDWNCKTKRILESSKTWTAYRWATATIWGYADILWKLLLELYKNAAFSPRGIRCFILSRRKVWGRKAKKIEHYYRTIKSKFESNGKNGKEKLKIGEIWGGKMM